MINKNFPFPPMEPALDAGLPVCYFEMPIEIPAPSRGNLVYGAQRSREGRIEALMERGFEVHDYNSRPKQCLGLTTPTDELTGLPLTVVPIERFSDTSKTKPNYHHYFHDRVLYKHDLGMRALRMSYGQELPTWLHDHYHNFFAGPDLPQNAQEVFSRCVLACAGVVPRNVIDFTGGDGPRIREASLAEYRGIVRNVHKEGHTLKDKRVTRNILGAFFVNYTIEQGLEDAVPATMIDEFLGTPHDYRRKKLGNTIIKKALNVSVDPVRPVYREVRREQLVPRNRPVDPWPILRNFFAERCLPDYHDALAQKLKTV